jgi:hypothetical protein
MTTAQAVSNKLDVIFIRFVSWFGNEINIRQNYSVVLLHWELIRATGEMGNNK